MLTFVCISRHENYILEYLELASDSLLFQEVQVTLVFLSRRQVEECQKIPLYDV